MVDFTNKEKVTDPIDLYNTLDRKSIAGPLRPVQEYVLKEWYNNRRNEKDLIIKLHTGEGKTLIGLLMLQSSINLGEGPCIYVCPNIFLVEQACAEAKKFGIPFCMIEDDNILPNDFLSGDKLLITHAHKIFNGKSIFGIGNRCSNVGTIILDDAHACIDVLKNSFTITIDRKEKEHIYEKILTLFADDLKEQGEGSFLDIESGENYTFMAVPYWGWINKKSEILKILSDESSIDEIKFVWPLIKDKIIDYSCFISGSKIEITPYNVSVKQFGTFILAKRRILMSATTQDDIFFIKGLDFSVDAITNPIKFPELRWSGEKMILIPSLIDEKCDRELVISSIAKKNDKRKKCGIVAIVPNTKKAKYYENIGARFPKNTEQLLEAFDDLRKGKCDETVVLNNRYDGIDLPDESCRVLIIDSIPRFDSYSDRYEENCRPHSELINKKIAQKIEQGMGRGVRGEKDYCAIIFIGSDVEKFMRSILTRNYFSIQTQKQIEIGFKVAEMAKKSAIENDHPMTQISELIKQMLKRDESWKEYYYWEMNKIKENSSDSLLYDRFVIENKIDKLFLDGEYKKASKEITEYINKLIKDDLEVGWYMEQKARYTYMYDRTESANIQKSAFKKNPQLFKPKNGIVYSKINSISNTRASIFKKYIGKFNNEDEFNLDLNEVLDNLSFGIDSKKFELALKNVGEILGYFSERPDEKIRKGPDNLWCESKTKFVIFECKNQVCTSRGTISKTEAGQFNNHCGWFKSEYGEYTNVLRIIIISTNKLSLDADFTDEVFVMNPNGLEKLKNNLKDFMNDILKINIEDISNLILQEYYDKYKLNIDDFISNYLEPIKHLERR